MARQQNKGKNSGNKQAPSNEKGGIGSIIKSILLGAIGSIISMMAVHVVAIVIAIGLLLLGAVSVVSIFGDDEDANVACDCYFLTEEEIKALESTGAVTITTETGETTTITNTTGTGGTGTGANISGSRVAGDWVNEAFYLIQDLYNAGTETPLWVLYGMSSGESMGLTNVDKVFSTYISYDSQRFAAMSGNDDIGIFQANTSYREYSQNLAGTMTALVASEGKSVENYNSIKSGKDGDGNWYNDRLYYPAHLSMCAGYLYNKYQSMRNEAVLNNAEYASLTAAQKDVLTWCYAMDSWNNGSDYFNDSSSESSGNDATIRVYLAAFVKLLDDPDFVESFKNSGISYSFGNRTVYARKFVMSKALEKGLMTQEQVEYINNLPYDNNEGGLGINKNGYLRNDTTSTSDWRSREINYCTNIVYAAISYATGALEEHGITVNDWGFYSYSDASTISSNSTTSSTTTTTTKTTTISTGNNQDEETVESDEEDDIDLEDEDTDDEEVDEDDEDTESTESTTGTLNYSDTSSSGVSSTPSSSSDSSSGSGTTLQLNFDSENYESGYTIGPQYPLPSSCEKLTVTYMPMTDNSGYPKAMPRVGGLAIHYNYGSNSVESILNYFKSQSDGVASHFDIDTTGTVAQYVSLEQYFAATNEYNESKYSIEVANIMIAGAYSSNLTKHPEWAGKNYQYTQESYNALLHLTAYLAYELNFDLDFDFKETERSGITNHKYWDRGTVGRHYDAMKSSNGQWVFRGKSCPADWVAKDGSGEADAELGDTYREGGQSRWISFKLEVIKYILKYKDDPNFPVTLTDGSEILGLSWAKQHTQGTTYWDSSTLSNVTTITGKNGTEDSSNTVTLDNLSGSSSSGSTSTSTETTTITTGETLDASQPYLTSCGMDTVGYCGCFRGKDGCECGCNGKSDVVYEWGNYTTVTVDSSGTVIEDSSSGGTTSVVSGQATYDENGGLAIPATKLYTYDEIKSTGTQRVLDTALVVFQNWYEASKGAQGTAPLYTQCGATSGYNYTGLRGQQVTVGSLTQTPAYRRDCSSYVTTVMYLMGYTSAYGTATSGMYSGQLAGHGWTFLPYSLAALQPGDVIVKNGHTELYAGKGSWGYYTYSWGSSQRLTNYNDGYGYRGSEHGSSEGINGYPMENDIITGPNERSLTDSSFTGIYRYTGE